MPMRSWAGIVARPPRVARPIKRSNAWGADRGRRRATRHRGGAERGGGSVRGAGRGGGGAGVVDTTGEAEGRGRSVKSRREHMEIVNAYALVGSYRGAAALCGTTHKTVKRVVSRRADAPRQSRQVVRNTAV